MWIFILVVGCSQKKVLIFRICLIKLFYYFNVFGLFDFFFNFRYFYSFIFVFEHIQQVHCGQFAGCNI